MSDIVIQVKGAIFAVGGTAILTIATGEQSTPEELGGWELHARQTGQVDLFAENDAHCLWLVRQVLSYFPSSADQLPPVYPATDPPDSRVEALLDVVPEDPKQVYDMHHVVELLADAGSVLELKPEFDGSLITALARLDGHSVGILANNPLVTAGAMGPGRVKKRPALSPCAIPSTFR